MQRCTAYCTAKAYKFGDLSKSFHDQFGVSAYGGEVISLAYKQGRIFCFDYGVVVLWNVEFADEQEFLQLLKPFEKGALAQPKFDEFSYKYGDALGVKQDVITLKDPEDHVSKLAVAFALAQSIKLSTYEGRIEQAVDDTDHISQALTDTGRVPLSRKAIGMKIGMLFRERSSINVQSAFLEAPDFFWEHPQHEPLYKLVANDLEVSERTHTLNNKLDMIHDFYQILGDELNARHGEIMELTIIALIFIEVIFGFIGLFG